MRHAIGGHRFARTTIQLTISLAVVLAGFPNTFAQQKVSPKPAASQSATPSADNTPAATTILGNGTAGTVPVFYSPRIIHNSVITQTGNGINVAGAVGAVAFSGDGSALTNVPAVQFGGLPPSAFAQTGASNTFSADQTINGNRTARSTCRAISPIPTGNKAPM